MELRLVDFLSSVSSLMFKIFCFYCCCFGFFGNMIFHRFGFLLHPRTLLPEVKAFSPRSCRNLFNWLMCWKLSLKQTSFELILYVQSTKQNLAYYFLESAHAVSVLARASCLSLPLLNHHNSLHLAEDLCAPCLHFHTIYKYVQVNWFLSNKAKIFVNYPDHLPPSHPQFINKNCGHSTSLWENNFSLFSFLFFF